MATPQAVTVQNGQQTGNGYYYRTQEGKLYLVTADHVVGSAEGFQKGKGDISFKEVSPNESTPAVSGRDMSREPLRIGESVTLWGYDPYRKQMRAVPGTITSIEGTEVRYRTNDSSGVQGMSGASILDDQNRAIGAQSTQRVGDLANRSFAPISDQSKARIRIDWPDIPPDPYEFDGKEKPNLQQQQTFNFFREAASQHLKKQFSDNTRVISHDSDWSVLQTKAWGEAFYHEDLFYGEERLAPRHGIYESRIYLSPKTCEALERRNDFANSDAKVAIPHLQLFKVKQTALYRVQVDGMAFRPAQGLYCACKFNRRIIPTHLDYHWYGLTDTPEYKKMWNEMAPAMKTCIAGE